MLVDSPLAKTGKVKIHSGMLEVLSCGRKFEKQNNESVYSQLIKVVTPHKTKAFKTVVPFIFSKKYMTNAPFTPTLKHVLMLFN